jgi:superfamily II DNA or RNA helicase
VAHREEILYQAESTFVRIHPTAKVGRYTGKHKEHHLDRFGADHFDYIVVD